MPAYEKPPLEAFVQLMQNMDELLNAEAQGREEYYRGRNGTQLEEDVYDALVRCAVGTPFEGAVELISGASFPDIVVSGCYGVEVKSTSKKHWTSIGSSILESTRHPGVEKIFLTFGKLGTPVAFKSRPYEDCLSGISVTHYPRYQIDMDLAAGETIFDKMGVPYDALRSMDNPVAPVSHYYKQQLKPGESLWWASGADVEETAAPPMVRLWSTLSCEEKNAYTVQGYALFPEILSSGGSKKYQRYALWLATQCGVINTNIRDQFSAGGRVDVDTLSGRFERVPAAFGRIAKYRDLIRETLASASEEVLKEFWACSQIQEDRLWQWCSLAAAAAEENAGAALALLEAIFER